MVVLYSFCVSRVLIVLSRLCQCKQKKPPYLYDYGVMVPSICQEAKIHLSKHQFIKNVTKYKASMRKMP